MKFFIDKVVRRHSYNPFDKIMERRKLSDLFAALFSQSEKNMEKLVSPILLEYPTDCFFSSTSAMVNQEPNVHKTTYLFLSKESALFCHSNTALALYKKASQFKLLRKLTFNQNLKVQWCA